MDYSNADKFLKKAIFPNITMTSITRKVTFATADLQMTSMSNTSSFDNLMLTEGFIFAQRS